MSTYAIDISYELCHNLQLAQEQMKSQSDHHRREVTFVVGDYMYLKLQLYRHTSVAFDKSLKLAPRLFNPFRIVESVGTVPYRLALPPGSQIHNVFHVGLSQKHLGSIVPTSAHLPPVSDALTILATRKYT